VFDEGLRFDTRLRRAEDYDFYAKASERYAFASMRGVTVQYNYNPNAAGRTEEAQFADELRLRLWEQFSGLKDDFEHLRLAASPQELSMAHLQQLEERVSYLNDWYQRSGKPFSDDFDTVLCTVLAHHIAVQPYAAELWRQTRWLKYLWKAAWPLKVKIHVWRKA
jgi:hypothetical protein